MHLLTVQLVLFVISITLPNCETVTISTSIGPPLAASVKTVNANMSISVWKEHITDPAGVIIYRASRPVDGPRKSRYQYQPSHATSTMFLKHAQLDDAGYYTYHERPNSLRFDFIISANHTCNGSDSLTVFEGEDVYYSCSFVYRGKNVEPMVWEGPGVIDANKISIVNQSSQPTNADCYNGTAIYSVKIRATPRINNTKRTASQYGTTAKFSTRFETGLLIVKCRKGFIGSDCHSLSCANSNPCKNEAVCTDASGVMSCKCTPYYTGTHCEDQILCSETLCQYGGSCMYTASNTFTCQCQPGYSGVTCESAVPTIKYSTLSTHSVTSTHSTTFDVTKEDAAALQTNIMEWFNYGYLVFLLVPIIGITALVVYMKKRKKAQEKSATESAALLQEQSTGQNTQIKEPGFFDAILSYF